LPTECDSATLWPLDRNLLPGAYQEVVGGA